ncbi:hypothetical protein C8Q75DRAFT_804510 [Abortiporus biennis]|nr:hypothetical protein C8Q75DRAFT_804510 [Abortiporus biennis]
MNPSSNNTSTPARPIPFHSSVPSSSTTMPPSRSSRFRGKSSPKVEQLQLEIKDMHSHPILKNEYNKYIRNAMKELFDFNEDADFPLNNQLALLEVIAAFEKGVGPGPDPDFLQLDKVSKFKRWNKVVAKIILDKVYKIIAKKTTRSPIPSNKYLLHQIEEHCKTLKSRLRETDARMNDEGVKETDQQVVQRLTTSRAIGKDRSRIRTRKV